MMKRTIRLSLSVLTTIVAISQNAHLYNVKANVIWKGVANEMGFYVPGKLMAIDVEGGRLEYEDSLNWAIDSGMSEGLNFDWETFPFDWMQRKSRCFIIPDCDVRGSVVVVLHYKDEYGKDSQCVKEFRPKKLDDPFVRFAGKTSSNISISRGELFSNNSIWVQNDPGSIFEGVSYNILGFEITISDDMGNNKEFYCVHNTFTGAVLQEIKNVKTGARIKIHKVLIDTPCGQVLLPDTLDLKVR
jgi:hypothetical protein